MSKRPPKGFRIGVDLGGTKIEAIVLDPSDQECWRERVPTPKNDYPSTLEAVLQLIRSAEPVAGAAASVGVCMPGAISPQTGLIKNANNTCLIGHPFDRDLAAALGRPVRVANDADCLAVSEASDGAGAGARTVFAAILGTGVGGGIVVGGALVRGPNAITGEWGHNPLPWPRDDERPGPACYCGRSGCIETFLSGPGLAADFLRATGTRLDPRTVEERALAGDAAAVAAFDRYVERLARAAATVINLLDPDVIVLGGGLSNIDRIYRDVPGLWTRFVFSDVVTTPLRKARHGDSSGVRGAAWLWPNGAEDGAGS